MYVDDLILMSLVLTLKKKLFEQFQCLQIFVSFKVNYSDLLSRHLF